MQRLPPLNALRAFDVAAQHLSFTLAARELHVTQAAISHQIRLLEDDLGVRLFRRLTRRLLLTEQGQILLPVVRDALRRIGDVADDLRADVQGGLLTVALRPYFSMKWLAPRLRRFWAKNPGLELRLHHTIDSVDFAREEIDMAVRWGPPDWPGATSELLLDGVITPVCSPDLLDSAKPLREPADLRNYYLLHEENYDEWARWLAAAGADDVDYRRGTLIDDTNVRLEAAIDGHGVALGFVGLIAEDLAKGRLVAPFATGLRDRAYYIDYPPGALSRRKVKAFRDWLLEEAANEAANEGSAP